MISNGSMSASRSGTRRTSRSSPTSPLAAISADEDVRPAAPRSCSATSRPAVEQLERALEQLLLLERVADLHGRALVGVGVAELGARPARTRRRSRRGRCARRTARRRCRRRRRRERISLSVSIRPSAHRVDEAVLLVRALEVDLAADRGDADRVAVVADAGDRALEQVARARRTSAELAEAQRVEDRDRPRADREDVAQDAADAGRGALERLDRARVVVRLDLERARQPVADVDRARVLARAHDEPRALGRQRPAAAGASACSRSARTTSARRRRARPRWARGPSCSTIRSYSASVSPSSRWRAHHAATSAADAEQLQPVGGAGQRVDRVLGVRHQPDDVARARCRRRRCRAPSR